MCRQHSKQTYLSYYEASFGSQSPVWSPGERDGSLRALASTWPSKNSHAGDSPGSFHPPVTNEVLLALC